MSGRTLMFVCVAAACLLHDTQARSKKKTYFKDRDKKTDLGFTRCHDCNSWDNDNCGVNFTVPYWNGVRCFKGEICRKISYLANGTLFIKRDCTDPPEFEEWLGCFDVEYMSYNATECVCDEDYCNRAPGVLPAPWLPALAVLWSIVVII